MERRTDTEYSHTAYSARELYELAVIQSHSKDPSIHRDQEMLRYFRNIALNMGYRIEALKATVDQ